MELFRQLVNGQTNGQTDGRTLLVPKVAIATEKIKVSKYAQKGSNMHFDIIDVENDSSVFSSSKT